MDYQDPSKSFCANLEIPSYVEFPPPPSRRHATHVKTRQVQYSFLQAQSIVSLSSFITFQPMFACRHICLLDIVQRLARSWHGRGFIVAPEEGSRTPPKLIFIAYATRTWVSGVTCR